MSPLVQVPQTLGTGVSVTSGAGSPEGIVTAGVGSLYLQTDAAASDAACWRKASGTGATGWVTHNTISGNAAVAGTLAVTGAVTLAAGLTATGDVVAAGGFRQTLDGWVQNNVTASQTDVEIIRWGASPTEAGRFRAARAGSVTGVAVTLSEARTAGTLTVTVFKNTGLAGAAGASIGLAAVIDGTNTSRVAATQAKDTDTFAAGDELYVVFTTDSAWLPTTSDLRVALEIED